MILTRKINSNFNFDPNNVSRMSKIIRDTKGQIDVMIGLTLLMTEYQRGEVKDQEGEKT